MSMLRAKVETADVASSLTPPMPMPKALPLKVLVPPKALAVLALLAPRVAKADRTTALDLLLLLEELTPVSFKHSNPPVMNDGTPQGTALDYCCMVLRLCAVHGSFTFLLPVEQKQEQEPKQVCGCDRRKTNAKREVFPSVVWRELRVASWREKKEHKINQHGTNAESWQILCQSLQK